MEKDKILDLLLDYKNQALEDIKNQGIEIKFQEATFDNQEMLYSKVMQVISKSENITQGIALILSDLSISEAVFVCLKNVCYANESGVNVFITKENLSKNIELKKVFLSIKTVCLITNLEPFFLNIIRLITNSLSASINKK
jgi:hypothetical protein